MIRATAVGLLMLSCTPGAKPDSATAPATAVSPLTTPATATVPTSVLPRDGERILVGAGDIAGCEGDGDEKTAAWVERVLAISDDARAFTLGDNVYPNGTRDEFYRCYEPSWGRFKSRTLPVVGNHDHHTENAAGYRATFAGRFTADGPLHYAEDLGPWRVLVIDSDPDHANISDTGPQGLWLKQQLVEAKTAGQCTALMMHHPRFSSGPHGNETRLQPLWSMFAAGGGDVVFAAHDHTYERFAPVDGVPEFVVGTGGRSHYPIGLSATGSQVHDANNYGVIVLHLRAGALRHQFLSVDGSVSDAGEVVCH